MFRGGSRKSCDACDGSENPLRPLAISGVTGSSSEPMTPCDAEDAGLFVEVQLELTIAAPMSPPIHLLPPEYRLSSLQILA